MSTVKTAILTVPGEGTSHVFGSLGRPAMDYNVIM